MIKIKMPITEEVLNSLGATTASETSKLIMMLLKCNTANGLSIAKTKPIPPEDMFKLFIKQVNVFLPS